VPIQEEQDIIYREMEYLDFELEIGSGQGREYPLVVVRSPAGEARGTMRFPYDELALQNRLKDLQIALLRSGGALRKVLSPEEQAVQDFGRDLFDALLSGEIRSRYDVSLQEAKRQGKGLRLKLRIQPPQLAALPWEFLYDPRQAEYLCLSGHTPIVRYLELPQPIQPLTVTPPLRILGMVASPRDLEPLDVAREKQRVEQALKDLQAKGMVDLTWLDGQTWRDLQRALRTGTWHVFHFIGHGGFDPARDEGLVALADKQGRSHYFHATELARLLANHLPLRLVLLNSCEGARGSQQDIFSSTAAILVRRGIPAVLAMQYEITDRAAIEFARAFYEVLADGLPVDAAVAEARIAVSLGVTNTVEWGTPVLYMRSPDGVLFQLQEAADRKEAVNHKVESQVEEKISSREGSERAKAAGREETGIPGKLPDIPQALPTRRVPISHQNAARVAQLARWGKGTINEIALSPDGWLLAVASSLGIYLYDAETLEEVRFIQTDAWVSSVAFSPDGQTLASGSEDKTVRLWRVADGALLRTLEGHTDSVWSVAFSPDGQTLASGGGSTTVRLWRVSDGALLRTLKGHRGWVRSVALSPDGQTLASGGGSTTVRLWRVSDGALLRTLKGHRGWVRSVAFSPDGQTLASGSGDNTVRLRRVADGRLLRTLKGHADSVWSVAFSPDGQTLASGSADNTVRLWRVSDGALLRTLNGHTRPVESVAFSPDGTLLASGSSDGTLRLWGVA
jgi:WD40 repeat protein